MKNIKILKKEIELLKENVDDLNTCDGTLEKLQDEIGALIEELEEINQDLDVKIRYQNICNDFIK